MNRYSVCHPARHASEARALQARIAHRSWVAQRAFTLLELILALVIGGMLVLSILGFYSYATDTRAQIFDEMDRVHAERLVMEMLTEELRGAMANRFLQLGLEGDGEWVRFPSTRVPGPGVWIARDLTDQPVPPEHDVAIVGYRVGRYELEDGTVLITGIERLEQTLMSARAPVEGEEIRVRLLTPHVKHLQLRYFADGGWSDSWSSGELPMAVEITLGREALEPGMDPHEYEHPIQRRVVFIPAGYRDPQGGVVRGLGR